MDNFQSLQAHAVNGQNHMDKLHNLYSILRNHNHEEEVNEQPWVCLGG